MLSNGTLPWCANSAPTEAEEVVPTKPAFTYYGIRAQQSSIDLRLSTGNPSIYWPHPLHVSSVGWVSREWS